MDATYLDAGMSLSRFKPADNATESRFRIWTGDATTPDKLDSTHGTIIIAANVLSMPFVDAINSTVLAMMEPKRDTLAAKFIIFLIMICLSAAAITAINRAPSAS